MASGTSSLVAGNSFVAWGTALASFNGGWGNNSQLGEQQLAWWLGTTASLVAGNNSQLGGWGNNSPVAGPLAEWLARWLVE